MWKLQLSEFECSHFGTLLLHHAFSHCSICSGRQHLVRAVCLCEVMQCNILAVLDLKVFTVNFVLLMKADWRLSEVTETLMQASENHYDIEI